MENVEKVPVRGLTDLSSCSMIVRERGKMLVDIAADRYDQIVKFCELTSAKVDNCIDEALYDWIQTTKNRLQPISQNEKVVDIGAWKQRRRVG